MSFQVLNDSRTRGIEHRPSDTHVKVGLSIIPKVFKKKLGPIVTTRIVKKTRTGATRNLKSWSVPGLFCCGKRQGVWYSGPRSCLTVLKRGSWGAS